MVTYISMEAIVKKYQLELLVLVGSYETQHFKKGESDIDLAYLGKKQLTVDQKLSLLEDLARHYRYGKIDVIDLQKASGLLKYQVATQGRLVYESFRGQFDRYYLYCLRYYYDTSKFRKLKQKYLAEQLGELSYGKN